MNHYQELILINQRQQRDLDNADESFRALENRLNIMISVKFIKNLDKYRILNLADAFSNICHYSEEKI